MANRILNILVFDLRLDPAEAEVSIAVDPERLVSQTDARGRLVGPRCLYATTVEVAYPLRPVSRQYEKEGPPRIQARVVIPEPCRWDPESPFLYQGVVELWENGQRCDQVPITHGLRTLQLGRRGLLLNGRPFTVRARACDQAPNEEEARRWRQEGINTLLVPLTREIPDVWSAADRLGFLVLVRLSERLSVRPEALSREPPAFAGYVLSPEAWPQELFRIRADGGPSLDRPPIGAELLEVPREPLPPEIGFVVCNQRLLPSLADLPLPKLVRPDGSDLPAGPDMMGWIAPKGSEP